MTTTLPTSDGRWAAAYVLGGHERKSLYCVTTAARLESKPKVESQAFIETLDVDVPSASIP